MEEQSISLQPIELAADSLGYFRWGHIGDSVVVTNDAGEWAVLTQAELDELLSGKVVEGHGRFDEFRSKGLIRDGLDLDALAARMAKRSGHVRRGPHLHVVTVNQPGDKNQELSEASAEKIVDFALQGTSPAMTFEFHGGSGEPLLNFGALRHFVERARSANEQTVGKKLRFFLTSNLTGMTEEIAEWMLANDVRLITTLDGPAAMHDANVKWTGGAPHADVVRWIEYFARRYAELERDPDEWRVDARLNATRQALTSVGDVIGEYVDRGLRTIHLSALDSARFDAETWSEIGYDEAQYLELYRSALDAVIERNREGGDLAEGLAAALATKILGNDDPGIVDLQSPTGIGTGLLAYDTEGQVFPCEEAQALNVAGDSSFLLGDTGELSVSEISRHPTVRAIAAASLLDSHPMYASRWNKPYSGLNPVRNYIAQGDLFGQRRYCFEAKIVDQVCTRLIELLADDRDTSAREVVQRWSTRRGPETIDRRAIA